MIDNQYVQKLLIQDPFYFHKDIMREVVKNTKSFEEFINHPIINQLSSKLDFDKNYYQQVYTKEFIYLWAFQKKFSIDFLIKKIYLLPDDIDENTTYVLLGESKNEKGLYQLSEELKSLESLVYDNHLSIFYILEGKGSWASLGDSPKKRLLRVLDDLKRKWINQTVVSEPWNEFSYKKWGRC